MTKKEYDSSYLVSAVIVVRLDYFLSHMNSRHVKFESVHRQSTLFTLLRLIRTYFTVLHPHIQSAPHSNYCYTLFSRYFDSRILTCYFIIRTVTT
ncbi:uncharacterized protein Smp_200310 [Schistosoma mansoni]|uniref:Smp_200310 n=1 Tax=Schistosoma mansoni TaxID=6183 RepID=G4V689_SCHMA|nr:uncharacterized protein Smp_200310 [Schistosoma mansoni]|eukprot:XP_018647593.1 uncharacterized protein Smp_200310 [Schistosoma mansoni]